MKRRYEAVVIGTSAGALDTLSSILPVLPADYPFPVFVVVHLPGDKKSMLAELLADKCRMRVREAEDKEPIEPGVIYFAPPDYHLLVEDKQTLSLSNDEPVLYSRPSIDVLFQSAADIYGEGLIGIVLTGASSDGAQGLATIAAEGGDVLVQSPKSAHVASMPEAAIASCPQARVMIPMMIVDYLQQAGAQCR